MALFPCNVSLASHLSARHRETARENERLLEFEYESWTFNKTPSIRVSPATNLDVNTP